MAANDGHVCVGWLRASNTREERRGTHNVKRGHTKEALGVIHTSTLEDLGNDRHGRVYRVRDDEHVGLWRHLRGGLGKVAHNRGIRVEEVVTSHTRLTWHTSRDDDDLSTFERLFKVLLRVTSALARRVDVPKVSSHTRGETDVIQTEVRDIWVEPVSYTHLTLPTKA